MKIALVHYRHFQGDGPERYFFNIKEILEERGHVVVDFSVLNSRNIPSPYDRFFLKDVDDEVHYGDHTRPGLKKIANSFLRMYYSPEARRKFAKLLDEEKPDIVYIMQYHNKISPSILGQARKRGIPVVHRISDFQYMCPNATFFTCGHICEDCLNGRSLSCIKNRCVHDSRLLSTLKLGAKKLHDAMGITRKIDAFVVPSRFTIGKLQQYGIPASKLHHIPTFYNPKAVAAESASVAAEKPFFLYVGRLAEQKGLGTLVDAFAGTGMSLKIIGESVDDYKQQLQASLAGRPHDIEFLGYLPFEQIVPYLEACRATVLPAQWYDNFPNAILESFGHGKPVIASRLGSLLEMVEDGVTGLAFNPGDPIDLRRMAHRLHDDADLACRMGKAALGKVDTDYSAERHYSSLISLFNKLTAERH